MPSVCHFLNHDKPEGTTELIGLVSSRDESRILSGTFIIGRDSRFLCGGAANLDVMQDATIALMDGAMTGKAVNQFQIDCRMQGGTITAGLPDRSLRRDARLGLGYSNWMNLDLFPDEPDRRPGLERYGLFSAVVQGRLTSCPAKGCDARLVVGWHGIRAGGGGRGMPNTVDFYKRFMQLQPKITIWVDPESEIENVRFEDLHRGGIVTPDAAAAEKWKNVTFGDSCLSTDPEEILRAYQGELHRGRPVEPLTPDKKYTSM